MATFFVFRVIFRPFMHSHDDYPTLKKPLKGEKQEECTIIPHPFFQELKRQQKKCAQMDIALKICFFGDKAVPLPPASRQS